jgi:ankyrin repeat protein
MASRDPRRGLIYLTRAAQAGLHDALMAAPNVFRSCEAILPGDLANAWASKVEHEHLGFITSRALSIFETEVRWGTHDSTMWEEGLADLWRSSERDSYDRYTTDKETLLGVAQMPLVWQLCRSPDGPVGDRDTFDHSRLPSFEGSAEYRFLSDLDRERFCSDLTSYNFLELADTGSGLTILQRAICTTDEPMVKFLVDDYSADLENHGNTTGWTPLWLAFATGQLSIAQILLAKGASIHCRDETTGFTLSHLVSRFASPGDIDRMVRLLVDNNGSNDCLNEPSQQQLTPLHMAFLISSNSHGHACRALLSRGADPTAQAKYGDSFITPISQCVLRLDASLLEDILICPHLSRNSDPNRQEKLAKAKAQAYAHLISQRREFEMRIMSGNQWYKALSRIISLLVDEDMQRELIVLPMVMDSQDALDTAVGVAQGAVAQCLLDFLPSDYRPSAKCLARAIERKQNDLVQKLIERGAELTIEDSTTGRNAFHAAAIYNPQILPHLIEGLVGDHETSGASLSTKEFLEMPNRDGFHVAGLLLFEGADDQQEYAEALRHRFHLGFDHMTVPFPEDELQTMTAAAIYNCIYGDFFPISVVRYLLRLTPSPAFTCSTKGKTLLICAVSGPAACTISLDLGQECTLTSTDQPSLDYVGHEICRLVLESYPELENLARGADGSGAIHQAASCNNNVALQLMWRHVELHCRQQHDRPDPACLFAALLNNADQRCGTALDYATQFFFPEGPWGELHDSRHSSTRFEDRKAAALRSYKWLREHGALHRMELSGVCLG